VFFDLQMPYAECFLFVEHEVVLVVRSKYLFRASVPFLSNNALFGTTYFRNGFQVLIFGIYFIQYFVEIMDSAFWAYP
jgi:hypothetical protein